jgi:hypothetical protein
MVEKWNIEYSGSKADDGLILFSGPCHPYKIRSNSAIPSIPTFQYSITPPHRFTAKPISSELAQRTRFSMLE